MDDDSFMSHMESEHPGDMAMRFLPEPGRGGRRLRNSKEWRTYHDTLHRLWPGRYYHDHEEERMPTEQIFLVRNAGEAYMNRDHADRAHDGMDHVEEITLHRPNLRPIYGGPTLLEALWTEMDTIMERLMTGQIADDTCSQVGYHGVTLEDPSDVCEHEDNGDKYRAQELAWVLAIVTNPYEPSVDKIRAETMARWNAMQQAAEETASEQQATIEEGYR